MGLALASQAVFDGLVSGTAAPAGPAPLILIGALLAAVAITALCRAAERVQAERLGQHYVAEVRALLFEHLTRVPARSIRHRSSGALLMRFVGDLSALRSWVSLGLARLTVAAVAVSLVITGLTIMAPMLGIAVAIVLIIGAAATAITSRALVRTSRRARRRRARLTGEVTERLTNVGAVQASGQERRERRRVDRRSHKLIEAMVGRARAAGAARGVAEATGGLTVMAVLLAGAYEVARGVSPGVVVGALTVVGLLSGYLRDLGRVAEYAAGAHVAREAAKRFLELEPLPEAPDAQALPAGRGSIELDDVHLRPGVAGISAIAKAGTTVAVVGPNGAGKSTLVSLIARLVDPDAGHVLLDGYPIDEVKLRSLREEVGVVSPDLPLMRGSLRRTVTYRHPRADDETVARVVEACDLDRVIQALPDGWDSDVGEGGKLLSSGQRARVELARAMLGDPRLLVLDEAEAHLDRATREVLRSAIAARTGTTIVISHHRETVEVADVVWHLRAGKLIEEGAPEELLAGDGPTAQLLGPATQRDQVGAAL